MALMVVSMLSFQSMQGGLSDALIRGDLPSIVSDVLDSTELPPSALQLELTESGILADRAAACATLTSVQETGVRIAIDDDRAHNYRARSNADTATRLA